MSGILLVLRRGWVLENVTTLAPAAALRAANLRSPNSSPALASVILPTGAAMLMGE